MNKNVFLSIFILSALIAAGSVIYVFLNYNRASNPESSQRPKLVIYSYSSFVDSFGPGPEIVERFKKICLCDIEVVDVGSGGLLLERLRLSPDRQVDVILGLDQLNLKTALKTHKWKNIRLSPTDFVPELKPSVYSMFIPFDWSPMTFLSRKPIAAETDMRTFLSRQENKSIALQAADLSSPGLQFMYWMWSLAQNQKEPLSQIAGLLKPKIHSMSPEWSGSYSFFQSKAADTVFTYLTSLVYHREKKENFNYGVFTDGHTAQIEYVGIPEQCMSCGIGEAFVEFITSPEIQKIIMAKNYMLPSIAGVTAGTEFEKLPKLKILPLENMDAFSDDQKNIMTEWKAATGE